MMSGGSSGGGGGSQEPVKKKRIAFTTIAPDQPISTKTSTAGAATTSLLFNEKPPKVT